MNIPFFGKNNTNSLDSLFYPKSIAVIGASNEISKIGGYIFSEIKKHENIQKYPINVKAEEIQGIKAYPNVKNAPKNIDLAIIAIPVEYVIDALKDCIFANISNIVIITAGFKEIGEIGKKRENELKQIIKENNLNVIGPNCLGILNPEISLNCSFAKDIPNSGDIALISQSGAVIDAIIDWSFKHNIGFSKIVSLGNMAGIDELKILTYLKNDKKTKYIVFYIENLEKGKEFSKILNEISKEKPVIIIKPGNSDNAKKAIGSHTGSLAQDNILVETIIKENNGIYVNSLNELFNVIIALKSVFPKKENLVILTNAGGPGVIATDFVSKTNFSLYRLTNDEKNELSFLPKEASLNNPIDILGDAKSDRYEKTLQFLVKNPNIENILILLTPQIMTDSLSIAKSISEIKKNSNKTIFTCFLGDKEIKNALELFDKENISNFQTPEDALLAMNYILKYNTFNYEKSIIKYDFNEEKIKQLKDKISQKKGLLDYNTSKEILEIFAINIFPKIIIKEKNEISKTILLENKKYVLKVDSKNLIHKKDIGAVLLNITKDNFEIKANELFDKIKNITEEFTLTLEEEVSGTEIIIGLKSDIELGNFIMFGMGGTLVNLIKDVNFSACPLSKENALKLVTNSKVFTLLNGYRGSESIRFEHLYELLIRMSYLQEIFPEIKEVDLNPVICSKNGVYLVDVKFVL